MNFRKLLFWSHLIAGCAAGAVILIMSLTGFLLMYERQMTAWAERGAFRNDPPSSEARVLPVEELLAKVAEQRPVAPNATLTLRSGRREPAEIGVGREGGFYVDPYTGKVLGSSTSGLRQAFSKLRVWHRWLGAEGEGRELAKSITGASNLVFLFIVISGGYLWIPRQWSKQHLGPIVWFRGGLSGKARDFNWHNVAGLWCLIPLFFVVLTALPISYQWAGNLIYRMTGTEPPVFDKGGLAKGKSKLKRAPGERSKGGKEGRGEGEQGPSGEDPVKFAGLNALWNRAMTQVSGWQSISAPIAAPGPATFTIDTGDGGQPQKRSTLVLDRGTAGVIRHERFEDGNAGRRLRSWSRFTHTGEAFGMIGQTIAGVASAAGVLLVWTGIALALRRFSAWRSRKQRAERKEIEVAQV